jgi:predicted RND superfamily exporter protein
MERDPRVGGTQAITDVIRQINVKFHEDDPRWAVIPRHWRDIGALLYLYLSGGDPADFDRWVNWDYSQGNIIVFFKDHKGDTIRDGIDRSKAFIQNLSLDGVRFRLCGGVIGVLAAINEEISQSQGITLLMAFAVIFITCSVTYRSWVAGVLFIIPLAISNLLTFAFMSAMKIGLNINTLPISSLGIGLGVDYGIYIVSRIKEEYARTQDLKEATLISMTTAGRAVLFTATTLTAGVIFWYLLSDMRFQAEMGLLLALWMIISMIGGMLLLPTVIHFIKPRFITRAAPKEAPRSDGKRVGADSPQGAKKPKTL